MPEHPIYVMPEPRPLHAPFLFGIHSDCREVTVMLINAVLSLQARVDELEKPPEDRL